MSSDDLPRRKRRANRRPSDDFDDEPPRRGRKQTVNPLLIGGMALAGGLVVLLVSIIGLYFLVLRPAPAVAIAQPQAVAAPAAPFIRQPDLPQLQPQVAPPERSKDDSRPAFPPPPTKRFDGREAPRGKLQSDSDPKPPALADGEFGPGQGSGRPSGKAPAPVPKADNTPDKLDPTSGGKGDGFVKPAKPTGPKSGEADPDKPPADGFIKPKDGEVNGAKQTEIAELARKLRKAPDPRNRMQAAHKLRDHGPAAEIVAKDLCDALADNSPAVVAAVIQAIEQVRPDLYQPLTKLAVDREPAKHLQAAQELGLMGKQAECCAGILLTRLRAELSLGPIPKGEVGAGQLRPMQLALFESLRNINPDDAETIKYYLAVAAANALFDPAKWQALDSLHKWAGAEEAKRKQVLPVALPALRNSFCVLMAIRIVGDYGTLAKAAAVDLRRLKLDGSEQVRRAAAVALDQVEGRGL